MAAWWAIRARFQISGGSLEPLALQPGGLLLRTARWPAWAMPCHGQSVRASNTRVGLSSFFTLRFFRIRTTPQRTTARVDVSEMMTNVTQFSLSAGRIRGRISALGPTPKKAPPAVEAAPAGGRNAACCAPRRSAAGFQGAGLPRSRQRRRGRRLAAAPRWQGEVAACVSCPGWQAVQNAGCPSALRRRTAGSGAPSAARSAGRRRKPPQSGRSPARLPPGPRNGGGASKIFFITGFNKLFNTL